VIGAPGAPVDGVETSMGAVQQLAQKLILAVAATLIMLATGTRVDSEELLFSPVPQPSPFTNLHQRSFGTDFNKNTGAGNDFKNFQDMSSTGDSSDQFRLGNSYLGIQTEKSLQSTDPLRRSDCDKDDVCADYSGLPKSEPRKSTVKSLRKPFIGLSITAPLQ
jgi:hypothetical protein